MDSRVGLMAGANRYAFVMGLTVNAVARSLYVAAEKHGKRN